MPWFKGNLHTHTTNSDGNTAPLEVAAWYRDHGYDFLALTDHNYLTVTEPLQDALDESGDARLLLVPGEELTDYFRGTERGYHIHVNGLGTKATIGPHGGDTIREMLDGMVESVSEQGGIASINHPNFWTSLSIDDLLSVRALTHFEIYNGHPECFSFGTDTAPSSEVMWDALLTAGRRVFGIAVDDAHDFLTFAENRSNPGRGWITVNAEKPEADQILEAVRRGRFYASTGPVIHTLETRRRGLVVEADGKVTFFGRRGEVVGKGSGYQRLRWRQHYLRAKVETPHGIAWTQPLWS